MNKTWGRLAGWLILVLAGAGVALLIAWLTRTVPLPTLLLAVGAVAGLGWLMLLVTVPWNLYFAARRVSAELALAGERGITVRPASDAEAGLIARRMLGFALAAHAGTTLAAAAIAAVSGDQVGYYVAAFFLLSTVFRPAAAYFGHVRERIRVLTRQSTYPREDVATLKDRLDTVNHRADDLHAGLEDLSTELRRAGSELADGTAHARQLLTADLARLQDAQAADRLAARTRDEDLGRRIDDLVRGMESTLAGVSDHQELLTGIRALVRMVRTDPG